MSAEEYCSEKNKTVFVPPDGGWGYMVLVAIIISYVAITGFGPSFGMIYHSYFDEIYMTSTCLTIIFALQAVVVSVTGFLTGLLLKKMSMRQLALIAALLFNVGSISIIFSHSRTTFGFCFGFLMSVGHGIFVNICSTILNDYFVEKRILALNISQTATAILSMSLPVFVKWSSEEYGFRGTVILITAISMHTFVAAILMQPAHWHMKKVVFSGDITPAVKLLINENSPIVSVDTDFEKATERLAVSFDDKYEPMTIDEENKKIINTIKKIVIDTDLKPYILSNASMAPMLCVFTELTYIGMFPQALYSIGWTEDNVTLAVSLVSCGDLATRIIGIALNRWLKIIGSVIIYIIGLVIVVITRLGMLWTENVTVMLVFIFISGIPRYIITTYVPLVIAESVPSNKFSSAMGLSMLFFGLFNVVLGPIIGAIRDITNSFITVFYILTSFNAIVVLFWSIELCYKRNKHKRRGKTKLCKTKGK